MPKKPLTAAEKRYRRWVADMPCEGCGLEDDTRIAHHFTFTKAGMGKQAKEHEAVCLCHTCHMGELHQHGEKSFWKKRKRKLIELVEYANSLYNIYHV